MQTPGQALAVVRDQFALKGLSDDALKLILPSYKDAISRIKFLLETMPPGNVERELYLRTQLETIRAQFAQVADRINQVLPEAQVRAFEEGLSNAQKYLQADGTKPAPTPGQEVLSGSTVGGKTVEVSSPNLTVGAQDGFISPSITRQQLVAASRQTGFSVFTPGGSTRGLNELLPEWMNAQANQVERAMRTGFLLGQSNEEIMREVGPLGPGRKGWAMTEALVRTGMAEASQSAHDLFYEANEDLLPKTKSGYRFWWDASNDTRLCEVCAPLDGIKFKERNSPPHAWPAHWNCRCKILPWTASMELREEEGRGKRKGSFLEATPVEYDKRGKRKPPPAGFTGDGAYKQPMRIDGKLQWVRRKDMGLGETTAGHMLQNANEHSKRMVLGKHTEAFNKLTGKGGRYEKDPQGAVRQLLGNGLKLEAPAKPVPPAKVKAAAAPKAKAAPAPPPAPKAPVEPPKPAPAPKPAPEPKAAPAPAPKEPVKPPKAALKQWTSDDGYKHMRAEQLRQAEANGVKLTPFERSQIEQYPTSATQKKNLQALTQYINNAETHKGTVYRGLNMGTEEFETMLKGIESGAPTKALESWTKNGDMKTFTIGGKNQVVMSVDNKRGVDISAFSEWGDTEQEVLQPDGVRYKVKSVVREEIDPGFTAKGVYRYRVDLEQLDD
jgi:outer membrane biosynthesis protein TonB